MLTQMTPGGRWVRPPFDGSPVYVPPKQLEAHFKRLISDGWMPIEGDPRREEDLVQGPVGVQTPPSEVSMQARIDQLEALVKQLLVQKRETSDDSSINHVQPDSESSADDRRSKRSKPAVQ
jgi:hypothetical protein